MVRIWAALSSSSGEAQKYKFSPDRVARRTLPLKNPQKAAAREGEDPTKFGAEPMGIIRSSLSFIAGTVCGIYIAQNYNVPNVQKLANTAIFMANLIEEKYRKPKRGDGGDAV